MEYCILYFKLAQISPKCLIKCLNVIFQVLNLLSNAVCMRHPRIVQAASAFFDLLVNVIYQTSFHI